MLALVLKTLGKLLVAGALIIAIAPAAAAHDIPNDITIQAFFKPEGQRLHYLLRVPLKAMREVEFPKRGPGFLDFARIDEYLRDRKSTRLNSSHGYISYAVFCLKKKKNSDC